MKSNSENQQRRAERLASEATVAAVERLLRTHPKLIASIDQFDRDPLLLNTPAGTVELKTGVMREHRREDYITKITAVGPQGDSHLWKAFLDRIMPDVDEQAFFQRAIGYSLTGEVKEHILFFCWGTGRNGKSVAVNTIHSIMNDYAKTALRGTFTATKFQQHPEAEAVLHGARLVSSIETSKGRSWDEEKIKAWSAGDPQRARFMRKASFEFRPVCKLWIVGNHKPRLRGVDEAIKSRILLIPFTEKISDEERDKNLEEKLKSEWGGILRWAIEGCLAWQAEGLKPPTRVRDATADYFSAEDLYGRWLEECCIVDRKIQWTATELLYGSFKKYCEAAGEVADDLKTFAQALEDRGLSRDRDYDEDGKRKRGFRGIGLRADARW